MKAAPITKKPSFPLMKRGDIQNIYHLQMPRWLFTDPRYMSLSLEAKVAYTFLLNRFQLSRLNGWINDDGEVFIIYTRRSLAGEMQVSYHKIIESMKDLTAAGLIWERRCGRGDANQIYLALVEHGEGVGGSAPFVQPDHEAAGGIKETEPVKPDNGQAPPEQSTPDCEEPKAAHDGSSATAPRSAETKLLAPGSAVSILSAPDQEVREADLLRFQSRSSRGAETELAEIDQRNPSDIDFSHIESSDTEISLPTPSENEEQTDNRRRWQQSLPEQEQLTQILENCSLWVFEPEKAKVFGNAIERLFYTKEYRIGRAVLPQANVRSRLWDLDCIILQSVEGKLRQNQQNIKNPTAYTMAVIFNAICEVQNDLLLDPYLNSLGGATRTGD